MVLSYVSRRYMYMYTAYKVYIQCASYINVLSIVVVGTLL